MGHLGANVTCLRLVKKRSCVPTDGHQILGSTIRLSGEKKEFFKSGDCTRVATRQMSPTEGESIPLERKGQAEEPLREKEHDNGIRDRIPG